MHQHTFTADGVCTHCGADLSDMSAEMATVLVNVTYEVWVRNGVLSVDENNPLIMWEDDPRPTVQCMHCNGELAVEAHEKAD